MTLLIRMKCSSCGKTFTLYPSFALPYKRYVSQQIIERSLQYLLDETMSYEHAARELDPDQPNGRAPPQRLPLYHEDPDRARQLASSTVHRWITTLGSLKKTLQMATCLLLERNVDSHRQAVDVAAHKYRSQQRKNRLRDALRLLHTDAAYRATFGCSIFPKLATGCLWQ